MRKPKYGGTFILTLFLNMVFNLEWTIPAWILLAMHFWKGWSLWLFWGALGLWFLVIVISMLLVGWAARCSKPTPFRENKNPYSAKSYEKK